MTQLGLALCVAIILPMAQSELVSNVFGSNMVIQRNKPAPIWGWAPEGTAVTVTFDGTVYNTSAKGSGGLWKQILPAQQENTVGRDIVIQAAGASVTLTNVVFGETIFCSGQR
jgi:sialate O-acetylesterase